MGCAAGVPVPVSDAQLLKTQNDNNSNDAKGTSLPLASQVSSKPLKPSVIDSKKPDFIKITNKQCSQIRLDHGPEVKKIPVTGSTYDYTIHYCYVSQKGYYPNALGKANQDSYLICENILGDKSCNLFGIFDGHGEFGDYCSYYSADKFSDNLLSQLKVNGGVKALEGPKMHDIYTRAFLDTNYGLHSSKIDDSLSGTTGVTILQTGDKLLVANVGDSRAIIASEVDGKLKYSPLSIDQTPYRKDERERLKKAGAKIMTMDQLEGNEPIHENFGTDLGEEIDEGGDPPRVWDSTLEKPGCAFSRSIGDAVAKEVGVTAEPEILEWQLTSKDKFAVVASDGVFEFITSQNVVDMIAKYPNKLEAAKQVVAEAYRLWLTYDDRTDDISIIVICFEDIKQKKSIVAAPKADLARMVTLSRGMSAFDVKETNRPVRKVMSKNKRKDIAEDWNKEETSVFDFSNIENHKSEEEIARISEMLSSSFMFQKLSPLQKDLIYAVMNLKEVSKDEVIIREGDQGDEMYIVDSGTYLVFKKDDAGVDQQIFAYNESGSAFGELSLMYGKPRGASVVATSNGKLWSIGRAAFRAVMMKGKSDGLLDIYQTVPVVNSLTLPEIHRLCINSKEMSFTKGELIVDENTTQNASWALCIVITGIVGLTSKEEGKKKQLRAELSFISIAEFGPKFSNAIAENNVKLSCIPKNIYQEILGEERSVSLKETVLKKKSKGKRLQAIKSAFALPENLVTRKVKNLEQYTLDAPIGLIGEFGYTGSFLDNESNSLHTARSYSKAKALKSKMDKLVIQERNCLTVISNMGVRKFGLPTVIATFQDDKWVNIVFKDQFVCDLALAIQEKSLPEDSLAYYSACVYSAICKVHSLGLIHRFLNTNSLFITKGGTIKLADFRYARRMEGSYCFTICGDPLYFAPEIVTQQGYDYSVDLWSFGILLYELHEGASPFGTTETDETSVFRAISAYRPAVLQFSPKTPQDVKTLIIELLQYESSARAGYRNEEAIKDASFYTGILWDELEGHRGYPVDIQPSVDIASLLEDPAVQASLSPVFDQF